MASLRDIRRRIGSVQNTRKITSAMRVVASAKMHQAQGRVGHSLAYQEAMQGMLARFLLGTEHRVPSALEELREVTRVGVVAVASDQGMCGTYNATVEAVLRRLVSEHAALGPEALRLWPVGRKMEEAVRRLGMEAAPFVEGTASGEIVSGQAFDPQLLEHKPDFATVQVFARRLCAAFLRGEVDRVTVVYHHFKNAAVQPLCVETFLPLDPALLAPSAGMPGPGGVEVLPLVEPSAGALYEALVPKFLALRLYNIMLDASLSEHAARALAMKVATDNADDLLSDLRLLYNKSRQMAITNELLDIAGGSQD